MGTRSLVAGTGSSGDGGASLDSGTGGASGISLYSGTSGGISLDGGTSGGILLARAHHFDTTRPISDRGGGGLDCGSEVEGDGGLDPREAQEVASDLVTPYTLNPKP